MDRDLTTKEAAWDGASASWQKGFAAGYRAALKDAAGAYEQHINVAMREYDDNLSYGDDALGPEFYIERGLERAATAIEALPVREG